MLAQSTKKATYSITAYISKKIGVWFFQSVASVIAFGFLLFFPQRVKHSLRFYSALFPGRKFPFYLWCTWRQYLKFTRVFTDRFSFLDLGNIVYTSSGFDHLKKASETKEGGIILMSHVGNWEIAAHLLKKNMADLKLLLYLGAKHKEQLEKMQKTGLKASGTKIVAVSQDSSSPFVLLESIKWMSEGGLVSLTGDIIWTQDQKTVSVNFLGKTAELPETPFMLALLSGKPIFLMFALPVEKNKLSISASEPVYISADSRKDRKNAVQKAAQLYADNLAEVVRQHPYDWYHFSEFVK